MRRAGIVQLQSGARTSCPLSHARRSAHCGASIRRGCTHWPRSYGRIGTRARSSERLGGNVVAAIASRLILEWRREVTVFLRRSVDSPRPLRVRWLPASSGVEWHGRVFVRSPDAPNTAASSPCTKNPVETAPRRALAFGEGQRPASRRALRCRAAHGCVARHPSPSTQLIALMVHSASKEVS